MIRSVFVLFQAGSNHPADRCTGGGGELSDFQYLSDQLDEMADEDATNRWCNSEGVDPCKSMVEHRGNDVKW